MIAFPCLPRCSSATSVFCAKLRMFFAQTGKNGQTEIQVYVFIPKFLGRGLSVCYAYAEPLCICLFPPSNIWKGSDEAALLCTCPNMKQEEVFCKCCIIIHIYFVRFFYFLRQYLLHMNLKASNVHRVQIRYS